MQDKTANNPTGRGRALLAVILVLVILVPVGYSIFSRVTAKGIEFPEAPDPKVVESVLEKHGEYRCVADTDYMRYHHWELLKGLREDVVRYGNRGDVSFDLPVDASATRSCWNCHQSKVRFCDRCHRAASVRPDCFGCHPYPD